MLVLKDKERYSNVFKLFDTETKEIKEAQGKDILELVQQHIEVLGIIPTKNFTNFVIDKHFQSFHMQAVYGTVHTTIWYSSKHDIYVIQCPDLSLKVIDNKDAVYTLGLFNHNRVIIVFDEKDIKVYAPSALSGIFETTRISIDKDNLGVISDTKYFSSQGYERIDEHIARRTPKNQSRFEQLMQETFPMPSSRSFRAIEKVASRYKFIESYKALNDNDSSFLVLEDTKYGFTWLYDGYKVTRPYSYDIYTSDSIQSKETRGQLTDIYTDVMKNVVGGFVYEDDMLSYGQEFFTAVVNIETAQVQKHIVQQYNVADIFTEIRLSNLGYCIVCIAYCGFNDERLTKLTDFKVLIDFNI